MATTPTNDTIKQRYDKYPTRGDDPSENVYVMGSNGLQDIAMSLSQLANKINQYLGNFVAPPVAGQFSVSIANNTLIAGVTATLSFTADRYLIAEDTDPGVPEQGTTASNDVVFTFTSTQTFTKTLSDWTQHTIYMYVRTASTGEWIKLIPTVDDGTGGYPIQPSANLKPSSITDFSVSAGTNSAVEITYSFTEANIVDNVAIQYDLYRTNGPNGIELLEADISTSGTYSSATPSTDYMLAVYYYPSGDAQGINSIRSNSSNIVSITTAASGLISAFAVSNVTTASSNPDSADVSISVNSASVDQVCLKLDNSTKPSSLDADWENLSGWTNTVSGPPTWTYIKSAAIDPISTGPHTGYAYVRDATYPTSISAAASDTFNAIDSSLGSTDFTMSFAVGDVSYNEEGAPTKTITITRYPTSGGTSSCDIAVQASGTDAEEGVNYWFPAQTVSFGASDATATVDLDILFDNLGYNSRTLVLVLSNPVSGGTSYIGNQSTLTVTIKGTYGYWANGDIDIFNPPPASALSGDPTSGALMSNGETLNGYAYKRITVGGDNCTISNCIVDGAALSGIGASGTDGLTVRNCLIQNTNNDLSLDDGYAIYTVGGTKGSNFKILANRFDNVAGGLRYNVASSASGLEFLNNYCGTKHRVNSERDLGQTYVNGRAWGSQGQLIMFVSNRTLNAPTVTGNKSIQPLGSVYTAEDHISTFDSGCGSATPGVIQNNVIYGTAVKPYIDSGTGILLGDKCNGIGYWTCKYNTVIESGTGGIMLGGGRNNIVSYNDIYFPQFFAGYKYYQLLGGSTNVGTYIFRVPGVNEGQFYNCTYSYNKVLCWSSDKVTGVLKRNDIYYPVPHPNGGINHGQTSEVTPTGYSTNVFGSATGWDGTTAATAQGEVLVRGNKHVLNQPAIDYGVTVMYASQGAAVGNGTLTINYDASPVTASWAEYGDAAGSTVDIETQSDGDERIRLYSANGEYIRIIADTSGFSTGTKQWLVKVSRFGITEEWLPYPDMLKSTPTGRWESSTPTTPTDTTPPSTVVNVAEDSMTSTTVTFTWDQATDNTAIGGYLIYRDGVQIAKTVGDPASPSYTDTGLTEGQPYTYTLLAYDTSNNVSASFSQPLVSTPVSTSYEASFEFVDSSEITGDQDTGIALTNCTSSVASGVAEFTASATGGRYLKFRIGHSVGVTAGAKTLYIKHRNGTNNAKVRVVIDSSTSPWTGDILSFWEPTQATMTEDTKSFDTGANTEYVVTVFVYGSAVGDSHFIDYIRIVDNT